MQLGSCPWARPHNGHDRSAGIIRRRQGTPVPISVLRDGLGVLDHCRDFVLP
jgi:hypothetical protein